jgi:uncharacterized protein (DUF2062 family)
VKRWARRLPDRETLLSGRLLRPFAHRLRHPALWQVSRCSVSSGVALGLFCAFLLPFGQIALAALLALALRANLAVAAAATFVTNPLTFPFIYFAAYQLGAHVTERGLGEGGAAEGADWILQVSLPTAVGLGVFAVLAAALGYACVQLGWSLWFSRSRPRALA